MASRKPIPLRRPRAMLRAVSTGTMLLDSLIRNHAVFLNDSESEVQRIAKRLDELATETKKELDFLLFQKAGLDPINPNHRKKILKVEAKRRKLEGVIEKVQDLHHQAIAGYSKDLRHVARDLSKRNIQGIRESFEGMSSDIGFSLTQVSPMQLRQVAKTEAVGQEIASFGLDLAQGTAKQVERELIKAYAFGESIQDAVARISYLDTKLQRDAVAVARTAIQAVANEAAHELYDKNKRHLEGKQWIATLDDRTCPSCGPLDGQAFFYRKAPRIDEMPRAPLHHQCRCFVVPFIDQIEIPTWSDWIVRQRPEVQAEILGISEADARAGRLGEIGPRFLPQPRRRAA